MWSNNDFMDPNYMPRALTDFESFMVSKKIEYNNSHSDAFNTVHVTDWAQEYIEKELSDLRAENTKLKKIIAKELSENDELGSEFTYVTILKQEIEDLKAQMRAGYDRRN